MIQFWEIIPNTLINNNCTMMKMSTFLNFKTTWNKTKLKYILRKVFNKLFLQAFLTLLFIILAIFFIKNEQTEVQEVIKTLQQSKFVWIFVEIVITLI